MVRKSLAVIATLVVLSACENEGGMSRGIAIGSKSSPGEPPPAPARVGETSGMSTPESVRYDAELDVFYVSNIVGNPSQKDGKSFIARVHGDSIATMTKLVEGGVNGATLNAPKGMAIVGDTLWVADIDVLRGFNRRTGAAVATVSFATQKAVFLNDVAAGSDGSVYITDTGIVFDSTGAMTHPGPDRVFKVTGRTVTEVASGAALANPNGITWDATGNRWILAPFGAPDLQALAPGATAPTTIARGPGSYDGVEVLGDGRILVSSWADSGIHIVKDSTMTKLISGLNAPADFGIDTKRNIIAVPRFNDGKVEYFSLAGR